ncbi:MAG TPA: amidohydrolase family protein [Thermoanaerobaculia bacterium]|nr:amidohydrolase family protein [Thermoanaerobaculia bacterium]
MLTQGIEGFGGAASVAVQSIIPLASFPETYPRVIIDVRCRLPSASDGAYLSGRPDGRRFAPWVGLSAEGFFAELDRAGIATAVSVSGNNDGLRLGARELPPRRTNNDDLAALEARFPGRFLGAAGIDVGGARHDPLVELERAVTTLGLRRIAIEPGRAPMLAEHVADRRLYPFYERAQELQVALFLQTSGIWGGESLDQAHPRWIDRVAGDFPDLHLICGHGAYPFVREMIAVTVRRANVFPSPDLYLFTPSGREWVYAVNRGQIADQFLFGSAFPLCGGLARTVDRFLLQGWRPAVLDRILYKNALRALHLMDDPRFAAGHDGGRRFGAGAIARAAVRLPVREAWRGLKGRRERAGAAG